MLDTNDHNYYIMVLTNGKKAGVYIMKVLTAQQMRQMDQKASVLGISGILLMEHAALALFHHIEQLTCQKEHIVILCGPGNNGGDGFALARLLYQKENTQVMLLCDVEQSQMSKDEAYFAQIATNLSIPWYQKRDINTVKEYITHADIVVDALFGTGLTRAIDGYYQEVITLVNQVDAYVLAVDIASGLESDTGKVLGCAIQADATVSFVAGKIGQYMQEGSVYSGKIEIYDICMPRWIQQEEAAYAYILDHAMVKQRMPKRFSLAHKGSYGKALLIGGSTAMSGAISLAAQATLLSGVGTLCIMAPKDVCQSLAAHIEEAMYHPMPQEDGHMVVTTIASLLPQYDVVAIGNGMGRGAGGEALLIQVLRSDLPCIVDGDGLYHLGKHMELLHRKAPTILTPHPKEVSYLLGIDVSEVLKSPSKALETLEKAYPGVVFIMKNTKTIISDGKTRFLNICGNDGLATGGSGDVLCGIVLGLLAQQQDALSMAAAAVYLHAHSADLLLEEMSVYSILPSHILRILPKTIKEVMTS